MTAAQKETLGFQTEVKQLLNLMTSIGLSRCTKSPIASIATRSAVGLYPCSLSNASISRRRIGRLIGPRCAVPSVKAGGAVEEPDAWT